MNPYPIKPETSTQEHEQMTTADKIKWGIVSVLVIGGSFFIGRSLVRKARATAEQKKTFEEGTPATYAKLIKMAFDNDMWFGWGTDEKALRKTVAAIPSRQVFQQVMNTYQKLYTRSMMADMQDELTSTEYNEMLAIIAAKPEKGNAPILVQLTTVQYQAWAKRLRAAFEITYWGIPGTDEDAIKAVFLEMPTQGAFWQTAKTYNQLYGDDMVKDLKSELEFWEYGPMMDIILKKPKT